MAWPLAWILVVGTLPGIFIGALLRIRYLPDPRAFKCFVGLVLLYIGSTGEALAEFKRVAEGDPEDAHASYYLAQSLAQLGRYDEAISWYQRAMEQDPYLRSAYYGAFQSLRRLGRNQEAEALAADYQRLENNPRSHLAEFKYTRMGPKADALAVDLAANPAEKEAPPRADGELFDNAIPLHIANGEEIGWSGTQAGGRQGLTAVDMQGDGLQDLFLTASITTTDAAGDAVNGNLVLQGRAGGGFTALNSHPLAAVGGVNAALWGDFDNDGLVDVYLCRRGPNQLWRQTETDAWEDITDSSGTAGADLDTVDGAFFDADHDGDLDLFLVNSDGLNELLNNNLDGTFRPLAEDYGLTGPDDGDGRPYGDFGA